LSGDDPVAICGYLQRVRKARPDVVLVNAERLSSPWYLDRLLALHPFLSRPSRERGAADRLEGLTLNIEAFLRANHRCGRPLFTATRPPSIPEEFSLVPAGFLWKVTPKGSEATDPRYWSYPVSESEVRSRFRRARGQRVEYAADNVRVFPERYESRLLWLLGSSRVTLAATYLTQNRFQEAARLFQGVLDADPARVRDAGLLFGLGKARYGLDDFPAARVLLERAVELNPAPGISGGALYLLGNIHRRNGASSDAKRCWRLALAQGNLDDRLRQAIERALSE
ncbi:MAG TPA: tetratricopeptide repeat protein, partial [Planctomycetota bacterium]